MGSSSRNKKRNTCLNEPFTFLMTSHVSNYTVFKEQLSHLELSIKAFMCIWEIDALSDQP